MSYLTLCQDVAVILRADNNQVGVAPTAVTSQTEVLAEIVHFVNKASLEIQAEQEAWAFRILRNTFNVSSDTRTYTRATIQASLSTFDLIVPFKGLTLDRHILCHLTATGVSDQTPCFFVPYEKWRGYFDMGTRPTGKPGYYTFRPDGTLEVDPTPDATYTLTFDYRRTLQTLSTNSDEPVIPTQHQRAIVWKAVLLYCDSRDGTGELYQKADRNYRRIMAEMRSEQLPEPILRLTSYYGSY